MMSDPKPNVAAAALSLTATQIWEDSVDGNWSSFWVQVGTPPQTLRLLPGTSSAAGTATWVLDPVTCTNYNLSLTPSMCSDVRGSVFKANESSSYDTQGLVHDGNSTFYSLNTAQESLLNRPGGNGRYAYETISFGQGVGAFPVTAHVLIASIAFPNDYWMGSLGLSPLSVSVGELSNQVPPLMNLMVAQGKIPSTTWAYTAGAYYRTPSTYGSLTLGGYDSMRFAPNRVSFPFADDKTRDLVVGLQSIEVNTASSSSVLSNNGIDLFLDSLVPELWLPLSICQAFEQRFNLTWNSQFSRYFVDDSTHTAMQRENPVFKFNLTMPGLYSSKTGNVQISLPYAAFDLKFRQPPVLGSTRYFPLRRADNSSQYTLGRVFFQEAYVIADYDRKNFSVSQALFPSSPRSSNIVTIRVPGANVSDPATSSDSSSHGLGAGALAGIAIGAVLVVGLIVGGFVWKCLRDRRKRSAKGYSRADASAAEKSREQDSPEPVHDRNNFPEFLAANSGMQYDLVHEQRHPMHRAVYSPPPMYYEERDGAAEELEGQDEKVGARVGVPGSRRYTHELDGQGPVATELANPCFELPSPGCESEHIRDKRGQTKLS